jgi:hypothetical protein
VENEGQENVMKMNMLLLGLVVIGGSCLSNASTPEAYVVKTEGIAVRLDASGHILNCLVAGQEKEIPLSGQTELEGFTPVGQVTVKPSGDGGYAFSRVIADQQGHRCEVTDTFMPARDSVRWTVEMISNDPDWWSMAIETRLNVPVTGTTRFWTAWSDPEYQDSGWRDARVMMPFAKRKWGYSLGYAAPIKGNFFAIPLATMAETATDRAVSVVLSPEDTLLDLWLTTTTNGAVSFSRQNHRMGKGLSVRFAMDITAHEADWRGGLRWMVARYPQFFNPPNPAADQMAGCGAYSGYEGPVDVAGLKKMAFRITWKLSDDFPYMGMFIPPVKDADERWERSCDEPTPKGKGKVISCRQMNDYAVYMKTNGFFVLNYFNVTEFGKKMYNAPLETGPETPDLWKYPRAFTAYRLPKARLTQINVGFYGNFTTDCGDPAYQQFLLEQADRHLRFLPDTAGICIDRMDWLRHYNAEADDGISFREGAVCRSLIQSWKGLMSELGPKMHSAGKVIFGNPMTMRLDLMKEIDGFYSEHGESGPGLNSMALLALRKPALTFTHRVIDNNEKTKLMPDPDSFIQRHLLMGVYPTAPYPYNNHAIMPSPGTDRLYLDYGPLLDAMRGKKWVLAPHCVETTTPGVNVNLFEVPGGYALPAITYGKAIGTATIQLRNLPGMDTLKAEALHPGVDQPQPVQVQFKDGVLELTVPLHRGCAMVRVTP